MIILDGRTGEGGGQLVRNAVALAAVTRQSVRIDHVRGNRVRGGGGLKAQHVAAVAWLAEATGATVDGLKVGSNSLTFSFLSSADASSSFSSPFSSSADASSSFSNAYTIKAATPGASASLMLQAVLPLLVLRNQDNDTNNNNTPVDILVRGGTHVAWAPSFDYLDQVLFPTLAAWFGIRISRTLERHGWSSGRDGEGGGEIRLTVHPSRRLQPTKTSLAEANSQRPEITAVDATIVSPSDLHEPLVQALAEQLSETGGPLLESAALHVRKVEESGHDSRVYVLLVARTGDDSNEDEVLRWGSDYLAMNNFRKAAKTNKSKGKGRSSKGGDTTATTTVSLPRVAEDIARHVVEKLQKEVARGGCGDSHLQDQVVVFQALAEGQTGFWRREEDEDEEEEEELQQAVRDLHLGGPNNNNNNKRRPDRADKPFGQGSMHAATARWVASELLPVKWYENGTVCEGIGPHT